MTTIIILGGLSSSIIFLTAATAPLAPISAAPGYRHHVRHHSLYCSDRDSEKKLFGQVKLATMSYRDIIINKFQEKLDPHGPLSQVLGPQIHCLYLPIKNRILCFVW